MGQLKRRVHLIMLAAGLLNVVVLPLWRLPIAKTTARAMGYPVFGLELERICGESAFPVAMGLWKRGMSDEARRSR